METTESPTQSAYSHSDTPHPLIKVWLDRIKAGQKHWKRAHQRAKYCRTLLQNISESGKVDGPEYNKSRANLIAATVEVVLSRTYAKSPELTGIPTNNSQSLKLRATTVARVTQAMLEDAKIKLQGTRAVSAAMTTNIGIAKVQYQRDIKKDPIIQARIQDTQDNIARIDAMIADLDEDGNCDDHETDKAELQAALTGLEAQVEVVAAEGLVIDMVPFDRLIPDPAIEDFYDYEQGNYFIECIPMRKSYAEGIFVGVDLSQASNYKYGDFTQDNRYNRSNAETESDDPMIMVYECWHKLDNMVYTLVDGMSKCFAREPYAPAKLGERWYPYFLLPFQTVDGKFYGQSLVDSLEKLQVEHNEIRDKEAELRKLIKPHYQVIGMVDAKSITRSVNAELGEYVLFDDANGKMRVQPAQTLTIDPQLMNTASIRQDWELVSGLQDAARSLSVNPKTATEASIMEQSLAARVALFRDRIEYWLTDIAKYSSELCMLNMTQSQVQQIMGDEEYDWPNQSTPDTAFNLVQIKIRAGSTGQPNKLESQDSWTKILPIIQQMAQTIRQIEATGGDASTERELVKETAMRFDEHMDVERFLPKKLAPPMAQPMQPQIPGMPAGMPMAGGMSQSPTPLQ